MKLCGWFRDKAKLIKEIENLKAKNTLLEHSLKAKGFDLKDFANLSSTPELFALNQGAERSTHLLHAIYCMGIDSRKLLALSDHIIDEHSIEFKAVRHLRAHRDFTNTELSELGIKGVNSILDGIRMKPESLPTKEALSNGL